MSRRIADLWRADRAYSEACRLARAGEPAAAVKAFDRVLATHPKHARARCQRARALAAAGRPGDAVRAAREASELAPRNHAPLLFLGQIQYDSGHVEEARKALSRAARLDAENRLVQAYLGLTLLAIGRMAEGAELLEAHLLYANEGLEGRLLTLAEQYLWERKAQARSLEEQLTPDEGARETGPVGLGLRLASAVRRVFLLPLAALRGRKHRLALLAEEAMSVGDLDGATALLKEAEKAGADTEWAALGLASVFMQARKPEAAVEQVARLGERAHDDPEVAILMGEALFEAGRYADARGPLEVAAARFSREFAPPYFRGLCEIALGRPRDATRWFTQTCERLNPHIAKKRLAEMIRVGKLQG